MRWIALTLMLACFLGMGCDKEIHEARTPIAQPLATAN
jgi:hypothetical protein